MSIKITCGHCGTKSIARVVGHQIKRYDDLNWRPYCLVACDNCDEGSLISFDVNSGWAHQIEGYEQNSIVVSQEDLHDVVLFPSKELKTPEYLPEEVEAAYLDAEFNFQSERWKAAAQLLLQVLEFACVAMKSEDLMTSGLEVSEEKIDLTKRINELQETGKITGSLKEWAHQIRVIGQFHKHRYIECSEAECAELRGFVDMFVRYSISMPKAIENRRDRLKSG